MEIGIEKVVSPREAASLLGVQVVTVYRWIQLGQLPAYRLPSGYIRIRETDLQAFLTPVGAKRMKGQHKHDR